MSEQVEPLVTNKQLQTLLARARDMSKDNRDTMWEALVFVRGTYERERAGNWQPLRADDPYFDDSPIWLDENGCVCWGGPGGETQRLVLHGDMKLCLFVTGEEPR
jgi:hypothetical protein